MLSVILTLLIGTSSPLRASEVTPYESTESGEKESLELNGQFNTTLFSPDLQREIEPTVDDATRLLGEIADPSSLDSNILSLDKKSTRKPKTLNLGWNYFSMPISNGGTAARINSQDFLEASNWSEKYSLTLNDHPLALAKQDRISELSPLEKYELFIGVTDFKLSEKEWAKGKVYVDKGLPIPYWYGACHGTAPATLQEELPKGESTVHSKEYNLDIEFTANDLKSLLAYAWANNAGASETMGQRCNFPLGSREYETTSACFDTNPGSFHKALLNVVGLERYPLIIDTSGGVEVWNRPILGYEVAYFNPVTRRFTQDIKNAIIEKSQMRHDAFALKRSQKMKYLVGAWVKLTLLNDSLLGDESEKLKLGSIEYRYDLELDENQNIIGGEWLEGKHPDFIWIVAPKAKPLAAADYLFTSSRHGNSRILSNELSQIARLAYKDGSVSYRVLQFILSHMD